jgi:adenylosuccinate synthase
MRPGVACYIGNGVVLSVPDLMREIDKLEANGVEVASRLKVSEACPIILPYHTALDAAREAARGAAKIGTTGKGIGPAYEDKVARRAIRVADLLNAERFAEKLKENLDYHNFVLTNYLKAPAVDFQKTLDDALALVPRLRPMVTDVSSALYAAHKGGSNLLFEGAQGSLLDVDHGTYPFVTSSNCVAGNALRVPVLVRTCCTTLWVSPRLTQHVSALARSRLSCQPIRVLVTIWPVLVTNLVLLPAVRVVVAGLMQRCCAVPCKSTVLPACA